MNSNCYRHNFATIYSPTSKIAMRSVKHLASLLYHLLLLRDDLPWMSSKTIQSLCFNEVHVTHVTSEHMYPIKVVLTLNLCSQTQESY